MHEEADQINSLIRKSNSNVFSMLSMHGKSAFFPKRGILSQAAEAAGRKINGTIGIALEDDKTPMRLDAVSGSVDLNPKDVFPYAPGYGKPDLRAQWKRMILEKNPSVSGNISMPVVTAGLTHGISIAGYLFCGEGDEIISPHLYWENYDLIFEAFGGKIRTFQTFKDRHFNVEGMKKLLMKKGTKKILILNFPNNPSGYTPTEEEAAGICDAISSAAADGKKIVAIIDDAYFGLVYKNGVERESLFSRMSGLSENVVAVKIDGPTKEDYFWGLRIGFITFAVRNGSQQLYDCLEAKAGGVIRSTISSASNLSQSLLMKALSSPSYNQEKKEKYGIMKSRYDAVVSAISAHPEYSKHFSPLPFNSGYFMCIEVKHDPEAVRQKLLEDYSTGLIASGSILRIAFSSIQKELIPQLFDNIYKACESL